MIEFVYFDLGNVLWKFDESRACENLGKITGADSSAVRKVVYESGLQNRFEHGTITPHEFTEQIQSKLSNKEHLAEPKAILDALSDMFKPIESMAQIMRSVTQSGCRIGILSNTCHAHWDWIVRQNHPLMDVEIDATVLSYEVNSMKPDDQIYRAAELAAGVKSDSLLFLDDKPENVQAAEMRGWKAEQCLGGPTAADALRKHGVIV